MVDFKKIEEECFEYLKKEFDRVIWLSKNSYSSIDFKCIKNNIDYFIESKYISGKKVHLSPNQKNVDAVVLHNGKNIKLIWKKDFDDIIVFSNNSIIKINQNVKIQLDNLKLHKRETYNEVIERLLNKN